jgi:hypothetical protein
VYAGDHPPGLRGVEAFGTGSAGVVAHELNEAVRLLADGIGSATVAFNDGANLVRVLLEELPLGDEDIHHVAFELGAVEQSARLGQRAGNVQLPEDEALRSVGLAVRSWLRAACGPSAATSQLAGRFGRLKWAITTRARNSLGEFGVSTRRASG